MQKELKRSKERAHQREGRWNHRKLGASTLCEDPNPAIPPSWGQPCSAPLPGMCSVPHFPALSPSPQSPSPSKEALSYKSGHPEGWGGGRGGVSEQGGAGGGGLLISPFIFSFWRGGEQNWPSWRQCQPDHGQDWGNWEDLG